MKEWYLIRQIHDSVPSVLLEYDTQQNKYRAIRVNSKNSTEPPIFSVRLRGWADDTLCREFIKSHVAPETRMQIQGILAELKLPRYDAWELFKKVYRGRPDYSLFKNSPYTFCFRKVTLKTMEIDTDYGKVSLKDSTSFDKAYEQYQLSEPKVLKYISSRNKSK